MSVLFALDFDTTIVEEDSDYYILKALAPDLVEEMTREWTNGAQWTDLCHRMVGKLHEKGFTPEQLNAALRSIAFNPAMKSALEVAASHGHVLIISDANTVYIDEISRGYGFKDYVSAVVTNPGYYDEYGRLHIKRHTTDDAHSCTRCPVNLCKGRELAKYVAGHPSTFQKRVYVGDGSNDFCPSRTLDGYDYVLPRKGYALSKLLLDPENRRQIKARVLEWETADDVLRYFRDIVDGKC
ncbi:Phospho-2-dehydro-3-deoxyheptonate aldolase AroG [Kappamyces sp. JEL0829]|nr:Phospho-2-dehydro-3-deoxyheptonate aldolase AroG [Kappamyces sp. JEL0829]KAJ3358576.1 Phospho-2-dehydro-3-deoxyheptonate aldolase AroG [Kappamyces sp. JEL0680]